jgi:hypothetical protein
MLASYAQHPATICELVSFNAWGSARGKLQLELELFAASTGALKRSGERRRIILS